MSDAPSSNAASVEMVGQAGADDDPVAAGEAVQPRLREASYAQAVADSRTKIVCGCKCNAKSVSFVRFTASFVIILCIGGGVFFALEEPAELQRVADARAAENQARADVLALLGGNQTLYNLLADAGAAEAFAGLDLENHWTFASSTLFAFTIVTTIGYGTFAPSTVGGQIFLVFYALLGIPVATMTLVYLADRALGFFTWLFSLGTDKIYDAFIQFDDDGSGELDLDEFRAAVLSLGIELTDMQFRDLVNEIDADGSGEIDQEEFKSAVTLLDADVSEAAGRKNRIKIVATTIVVWLALGVLVFCLAEEWDFETAFYFTFVTLTTVGLGDFYPNTAAGRVFLVCFAMVGLGLVATLLTLIEQFVKDIEKHRKAALEKAREAAIKAREASGTLGSSGRGSVAGLFRKTGRNIVMVGRTLRRASDGVKKKDSTAGAGQQDPKHAQQQSRSERRQRVLSKSSAGTAAAPATASSNSNEVRNPLV